MTDAPSQLGREVAEIPEAAARLASEPAQALLRAEAARLRALAPPVVLTAARGSSDHAATVLKYAVELSLGLPVASVGPSVASVYGAALRVPGAAALALSQSGASADLAAVSRMLRAGGARLVVLTNRPDSPLGREGSAVIDVLAGPERAVAATKSFVSTVVAGLWLVVHWSGDAALPRALRALPDALAAALEADAATLDALLASPRRLTAVGRGPHLGLALEAGLKIREVLGRPADGYSAAEVLHGPATLIDAGSGILAFGDASDTGTADALAQLDRQGAAVVRLARLVPEPVEAHPLTVGLGQIAMFYAAVERAARAAGLDPDRPRFLSKETVTI